ncbi:hypothetical protein MLD38_016463 [Melastoma candidum]|uniref:Uncharacterized protein n=1 Tax=Melastoma candidum TaxID=119954 RepID=A0ACB9QMH5_9MYRT|nr:hypothetical protein MLD38_016463 [Melastoma candidum]
MAMAVSVLGGCITKPTLTAAPCPCLPCNTILILWMPLFSARSFFSTLELRSLTPGSFLKRFGGRKTVFFCSLPQVTRRNSLAFLANLLPMLHTTKLSRGVTDSARCGLVDRMASDDRTLSLGREGLSRSGDFFLRKNPAIIEPPFGITEVPESN